LSSRKERCVRLASPRDPIARVALAPLTTLGVGGSARWLARAASAEDVRSVVAWAGDRQLPLFVLGGGSNLVVADEGWPGFVLQIAISGIRSSTDGEDTLLSVAAGEVWDEVVEYAVKRDFAGVECLSGIPGTVGGTPVQNVGAYGQEVGSVIEYVTVIDRRDGTVADLAGDECGFSYRMSRFKGADLDRFIVSGITLRLRRGLPTLAYPDVTAYLKEHAIMSASVADVRRAILAIRRRKGMVLDPSDPDTRSVGSFFMNPVVATSVHAALRETLNTDVPSFPAPVGAVKIPAAWLIERAGFARGFATGAVGLSTKHPLAIVNRGGASARDVVALAVRIKRQVADRFGIALRTEPVFVGFGDDPDVAYLVDGQP
jgi:UDP-N-acetylmuramate dehydrogenase